MHRQREISESRTYSLAVGDADAARLELLHEHYDPSSRAFLESAGVAPGDSIVDVGCGHGTVTRWMADCVGASGRVYALDASIEQLDIARQRLRGYEQVSFVHSRLEDAPFEGLTSRWVYSRFLLMHVADPLLALKTMARMLADDGRLLLEVADVMSLRFVPSEADSALWKRWWGALGEKLGASYDVAAHMPRLLEEAGFVVERSDRFQPVSTRREAKLLHALGFEQLIPKYLEHAGAERAEIEGHLQYLRRVVDDPGVTVELYCNSQYVARRR